jgi:hypothetical protein
MSFDLLQSDDVRIAYNTSDTIEIDPFVEPLAPLNVVRHHLH